MTHQQLLTSMTDLQKQIISSDLTPDKRIETIQCLHQMMLLVVKDMPTSGSDYEL